MPSPAVPARGSLAVHDPGGEAVDATACARLGLPDGEVGKVDLAVLTEGHRGVVVRRVAVRLVPLADALPALLTVPTTGTSPFRRVPDSLRSWAVAARIGLRLVAAHRIAPALVAGDDNLVTGVWRALPDDDEEAGAALAQLAAWLPPAARSAVNGDGRIPDAAALVRAFVDAVADLAVRSSAAAPRSGRPRDRLLPWTARWAEALADSEDPVVPLRDDAAELVAGVTGWLAGGAEGAAGTTQLRLISPDDDAHPWVLDVSLRTDDGVLLPAEEVWSADPDDADTLAQQESLLRGLGRCARVFPPLDRALQQAEPTTLQLDLGDAWAFIAEAEPLLRGAGIVVVLPADVAEEAIRLRLRIGEDEPESADDQGPPLSGEADYSWEVTLGGEELADWELDELAAATAPLVRWRDRWLRIDTEELRRLRTLGRGGRLSLADALTLSLAGTASVADITGDERRADEHVDIVAGGRVGRLADALRSAADRPKAVADPPGFVGELRPYQRRGVAWLGGMAELGLGAVLADDMGLGKCVGPDTPILVNGGVVSAEHLWATHATELYSDGEGEWAAPRRLLRTEAMTAAGDVVTAAVTRLYRQWIDEPVRRITLDDGRSVVLTGRHRLFCGGRWTNRILVGETVAVAARSPALVGGAGDRHGAGVACAQHHAGVARVASVQHLAYRGWVYDLEVAEHHNFVGAGIFCHNTIELIGHLLAQGVDRDGAPALVICPTSVVGNWQREIERFGPSLRVTRWHGTDRPLELGEISGVVVTTYGTLRRDVDQLAEIDWSVVALDEAQHVKNPQTAGARAVRRLRSRQTVALTGTPLENRLAELWALLDVTNPGLLGTRSRFTARYVAPIEKRHDRVTAARLRRLVSPFVLRRSKSDPAVISDLPDKIERTVPCSLTPEQARLYSEAVARVFDQDALGRRSAMERRGRILALLTALKQICNHPAHFLSEEGPLPGRSGKLAAAREIVAEATDAGDQVLVFTQYVAMGHLLVRQLGADLDVDVPFLHGGVTARARDRIVDSFQAGLDSGEAPPVLVVSLRAGGTGLNLTAATHVLHYDRWWNPAVEDQATDRTHRIGQQRTVEVHKLVTAGTVEERIDELLTSKRDLADAVVGTGETWITELADSELRELVSLSATASITDLEDDTE